MNRSNPAMHRTADRSAFPLSMSSTLNLQPHTLSPAVNRPTFMKWEYTIYSIKQPSGVLFRGAGQIPVEEIIPALNKLGSERWEVVSAFPIAMAEGATNMLGILLKRPVSPEAEPETIPLQPYEDPFEKWQREQQQKQTPRENPPKT